MADMLAHKSAYDCMVIVRDFINNSYSGVTGSPIEDPWETATSQTRDLFAQIEDEVLGIARFPKITIGYIPPISRERIGGGKSQYRERFTYNFRIMYVCEKRTKWTKDSVDYLGTHQCIKYLDYLGNKLKQYSGSFEEFSELVIGSVSNVAQSPDGLKYTAFLPIKIDSYGRI